MFICGPEKDAKKRTQKLGDLKQLVESIEEKMLVPCSFVCCPLCTAPPVKEPPPPSLPEIMVCYKTEKVEKKKNGRGAKRSNQPKRRNRAKSRELRAGILYQGCDCEKRNGLQDDCRRTGCHGSPECLTKPEPNCGPSEFSNGKHLGRRSYWETVKSGEGDNGGGDDDGNGKVTVYYNCYPAAVKC